MPRRCTRPCVHQFVSRWCWSSRHLFLFCYIYALLHFGFLEFGDIEKQTIGLSEWFFVGGGRSELGLVINLYYLWSSASPTQHVISFVEHMRIWWWICRSDSVHFYPASALCFSCSAIGLLLLYEPMLGYKRNGFKLCEAVVLFCLVWWGVLPWATGSEDRQPRLPCIVSICYCSCSFGPV
jgi:hypothetical protein